jgi:hypothetical protein
VGEGPAGEGLLEGRGPAAHPAACGPGLAVLSSAPPPSRRPSPPAAPRWSLCATAPPCAPATCATTSTSCRWAGGRLGEGEGGEGGGRLQPRRPPRAGRCLPCRRRLCRRQQQAGRLAGKHRQQLGPGSCGVRACLEELCGPPPPLSSQVCPRQVCLLAGCAALVQVPLAELLLELDADPDEVEELEVAAACVQVGVLGGWSAGVCGDVPAACARCTSAPRLGAQPHRHPHLTTTTPPCPTLLGSQANRPDSRRTRTCC